jgi:hypothetical protein
MALRPFGLEPHRPLSACRQALATIRAVADGREDSASGYRPAAFGFSAPELPVYIGARGERFNRWASEAADGVFIAGVAPAVVGDVIGWARSVRQVDISLYVSCSFAPEQVERTRPRMLHAFLNGPAALRERAGLAMADLQAASDALASGDDRAARALITEDRLAMVHFSGDPVGVAERIVALARCHHPRSVGITMLGDEFDAATAALHHVRKELS